MDTIAGNITTTQTLVVGTSASSAIDFVGDTDWWKVNLEYGFQYQVWINGTTDAGGAASFSGMRQASLSMSTAVAAITAKPLQPGPPPSVQVDTSTATSAVHVGLVGYLSGDVDGSFAGAAGAQDLDLTQPAYFQNLSADTGLNLSQFGIYT